MQKINLSYVPEYQPIVINPTRPIIPLRTPKPSGPRTENQLRFVVFMSLFTLAFPLSFTLVVLNSCYQNYTSARRIQRHFQDREKLSDTAEDTRFSEAVQGVYEGVVDTVGIYDEEDYYNGSTEETGLPDDDGFGKPMSMAKEEYKLPLTDEHLGMLNGLKSIPWQIFGVHIGSSMHSHAAIIRRSKNRNDFVDGSVVIRHMVETQFQA
jgi:hypothetical protein